MLTTKQRLSVPDFAQKHHAKDERRGVRPENIPEDSRTVPNTLIHIALQTPATRAVAPQAAIPWVLTGVLIPDLPWILQRIALFTGLVDPYQIRLYSTIQASLLFCLLLAFALSLFARRTPFVFAILAANALLHLLLDALQIKWGNGVILLAPFSWQPVQFGLIWPEHMIGYLLTALGVVYLFSRIKTIPREGVELRRPPLVLAAAGLALYFLLPPVFMSQLEDADANSIDLVRYRTERQGREIELDRTHYSAESSTVTLFSGERIRVLGALPKNSGIISLRGTFTSPQTLTSSSYHLHNDYRDYASKAGILLSLAIWGYLLIRKTKPYPARKE